jgi:hypothetical protein
MDRRLLLVLLVLATRKIWRERKDNTADDLRQGTTRKQASLWWSLAASICLIGDERRVVGNGMAYQLCTFSLTLLRYTHIHQCLLWLMWSPSQQTKCIELPVKARLISKSTNKMCRTNSVWLRCSYTKLMKNIKLPVLGQSASKRNRCGDIWEAMRNRHKQQLAICL